MNQFRQPLTKTDLRLTFRCARKQLPAEDKAQRVNRIVSILTTLPIFNQASHIGIYWPYDGEVDTLPIMEKIWSAGKKSYLSCLDPNKKRSLIFKEYKKYDQLIFNKFNIPEPATLTATVLAPTQLHLVIVPIVAFDRSGHRLGMGGGYYDTTFSFLVNDKNLKTKPSLIGLAYSFQHIQNMPLNHWDIALSGVITEHCYMPSLS